jgi:hypothetical protein
MKVTDLSTTTCRTLTVALLLLSLVTAALEQGVSSDDISDESNLSSHGHYINRNGHEVHQPAKSLNGSFPSGATARCRDGDYSFSEHHPGTCSGHGGVAQWLR